MSLDFNCKNVRGGKDVYQTPDGKHWTWQTQHLSWGAFIGPCLQSITEKNIDEWEFRMEYLYRLGMQWMNDDRKLTRQDLENFIGFTTNCYPEKTRAQFLKATQKLLVREIELDIVRKAGKIAPEEEECA